MKKVHRVTMIIACLALFCWSMSPALNAQTEKYEPLLGIWDVETESGSYTFIFEFSMQDGVLTGKFTGSSGETEMEDLTFEDNELKFFVSVDAGGQDLVVDFSATINGENLEGMLSLEFGEANITGTKRKE